MAHAGSSKNDWSNATKRCEPLLNGVNSWLFEMNGYAESCVISKLLDTGTVVSR